MKIIKYIPFIIIIIFLCLFYAYQNGYYEKYTRDKINLTNEYIEKFEQDVLDGKDITLENYLEQDKNYSTKISNISLKMSNKLEKIINSGIKYIFKKISSVVE